MNEVDLAAERRWTRAQMSRAGLLITDEEEARVEIADFGLEQLDRFGLQLLTYVNTARVCAKELVLKPRQICPEHRHPNNNGEHGKEETFRCRRGTVYLYVEGERSKSISADISADEEAFFSVWHEVILQPGDQYTVMPDHKHWFQAGDDGAIVSEFSTRSTDEHDVFTDRRVVRLP